MLIFTPDHLGISMLDLWHCLQMSCSSVITNVGQYMKVNTKVLPYTSLYLIIPVILIF